MSWARGLAAGVVEVRCPSCLMRWHGCRVGAGYRSARETTSIKALRPGNHYAVGFGVFIPPGPLGFDVPNSLDSVSTGQVAFVVQPTFLYELIWNI